MLILLKPIKKRKKDRKKSWQGLVETENNICLQCKWRSFEERFGPSVSAGYVQFERAGARREICVGKIPTLSSKGMYDKGSRIAALPNTSRYLPTISLKLCVSIWSWTFFWVPVLTTMPVAQKENIIKFLSSKSLRLPPQTIGQATKSMMLTTTFRREGQGSF